MPVFITRSVLLSYIGIKNKHEEMINGYMWK